MKYTIGTNEPITIKKEQIIFDFNSSVDFSTDADSIKVAEKLMEWLIYPVEKVQEVVINRGCHTFYDQIEKDDNLIEY